MTTVHDHTVLIRGMDVTARLTDQVVDLSERPEGGVLLETLIGRYVLDSDARVIWLLIDGRRTFGRLVDDVAAKLGMPADEVRQQTHDLCSRLLERGLVEVATPADIAALPDMAAAE
ncbi:PqqD family protein [Streptomyces wedmorensis]|uniref:PqqD family protein n=1 Tax=Streptomyces wedmorensis TaxID=43759 RepID=UPI00342E76EF